MVPINFPDWTEPELITFFVIIHGVWIPIHGIETDSANDCGGQDRLAGCDQFMPIGPDAVLVQFNVDADLLWYPDESAQTGYKIKAGQTAWMIGSQDGYAKIVWSCNILWVDLGAIGSPDD
jgi:hypothetical protein